MGTAQYGARALTECLRQARVLTLAELKAVPGAVLPACRGRLMLSLAMFLGFSVACSAPSRLVQPPVADHHVHLNAPEIQDFLPYFCNSPAVVGGCSPSFVAPHSASELLAQMNRVGIRCAALLSTGYLAESGLVALAENHAALLRAGNRFTVAQAAAQPDRFVAFVSVNPLTDTALPELAFWKDEPFVAGVKLHLTNSDLNLRASSDVRKLVDVFGAAADNGWAIIIHLRTGATTYGARDVRILLRDVLPAAQGGFVQVAHAGGWGRVDAVTLDALEAFAAAIEAAPTLYGNLYFDLAGVWDAKTKKEDLQMLANLIRRIGVEHFLPASDWPFHSDLTKYYGAIYSQLPLTDEEWRSIRTNVAPYLADCVAAADRR